MASAEDPEEVADATRRTTMAAERTVLAWLRTGLTVTAVGVAVGQVVPRLSDTGAAWPYAALGATYVLMGAALVVYGVHRGRQVDRALRAGEPVPVDERVFMAIVAMTLVLALAAAVLIVADA